MTKTVETAVVTLNGRWKYLFQAALVIIPAILAVQVAVDGWVLRQIVEVKQVQAGLVANRLTSKDEIEVWKSIAECKQDIAVLGERIVNRSAE